MTAQPLTEADLADVRARIADDTEEIEMLTAALDRERAAHAEIKHEAATAWCAVLKLCEQFADGHYLATVANVALRRLGEEP